VGLPLEEKWSCTPFNEFKGKFWIKTLKNWSVCQVHSHKSVVPGEWRGSKRECPPFRVGFKGTPPFDLFGWGGGGGDIEMA